MFACIHGHKDVVQLLLNNTERNIYLNARNNFGKTALIFAGKNGQNDVVRLLREKSERDIDFIASSN